MKEPPVQVIELGVHDFLELTLKVGGPRADIRPYSRAAQGIITHNSITSRRSSAYQREVSTRHEFTWNNYQLIVRGRIDGLEDDGTTLYLEEIKSSFRPLSEISSEEQPFHLAQLRLYHHFTAVRYPEQQVIPILTYANPETLEERSITFDWTPASSRHFFERLALALLRRIDDKQHWRMLRDASIQQLQFPYPQQRAGQAELMQAVTTALQQQHDLLAEAATGIGKTMGVLYPAIRQFPENQEFSRIFYLTAKSAGVEVARAALQTLREQGLRLRTLVLQAKQRVCPMFDGTRPECDEQYCPYAENLYARIDNILPQLLVEDDFSPELIAHVSEVEKLCPFELALELSLYSDLIICDYNYVFDPMVVLKRFFFPGLPNDNVFLLDEAHNLVPRSREMYSAWLCEETIQTIRLLLGTGRPTLAANCQAMLAQFAQWHELLAFENTQAQPLDSLPETTLQCLDALLENLCEALVDLPRGELRYQTLDCFFELRRFSKIAAQSTHDYAVYLHGEGRHLRLRLLCLHPGPLLRERIARSIATVFFSATLSPLSYYQELLGARFGSKGLSLPSPFPPENRLYLHIPEVSTKYTTREATKPTVAQVILNVARAKQGNYLAFFPSYAYMGAVWAEIMLQKPGDIITISQKPGMTLTQQVAFLNTVCAVGDEKTKIGLAVMGGLFGEAIDLPGEQLIGAIIVGPGLPGVNLEQELLRDYFDQERDDSGFYYAYMVPGMTRVIQAAGRVFRTPQDRGVIILVDDRFLEPPYRNLLPPDWDAEEAEFSREDYQQALSDFWNHTP